MHKDARRRIVPAAAGLVLTLAASAAAIPTANAATATRGDHAAQSTPHKGGTLEILNTSPLNGEAALDPASYYSDISIPELIFRSLTTYKRANGQAGTEVVPDLATDTGEPNADFTAWTYHLKSGIKFDDGTPVTSADIRYAVERSFESIHAFGPTYLQKWLKDAAGYEGPADGQHLDSIETPDARTITFELASPHSDFPKLATMFQFSPVPQSRDDGADYHLHPASTGPYKVVSDEGDGLHVVLKRNPYWSPATDTERKAYPDTVDIQTGLAPDVISQRLLQSAGPDAAAISTSASNVSPSLLPQIDADPALKSRLYSGQMGFTNFLAMNPKVAPFDNEKVREAINYAINRTSAIDSVGGSDFAEPATTFLPPMDNYGYKPFDNFPAGATGNPDMAKQLLAEAGYPNGLTITLYATTDSDRASVATATAVQEALAKAGITVEVKSMPFAEYDTIVYDSTKEPGAFLDIWSADYPAGNAMIEPIFDGREIVNGLGNFNFAQLNDPTVNAQIDALNKLPDAQQGDGWGELDQQIGSMALDVPLFHPKNVRLAGSAVRNVVVSDWTGVYDPSVIAVK